MIIQLDILISDHHGAGRKALQTICDYADLTGKVILLSADSHLPSEGIEGSPAKDEALVGFYKSFGFTPSTRRYYWENQRYTKNIMERKPNDHPATVSIR